MDTCLRRGYTAQRLDPIHNSTKASHDRAAGTLYAIPGASRTRIPTQHKADVVDTHKADGNKADIHKADTHEADIHKADIHKVDIHKADIHKAERLEMEGEFLITAEGWISDHATSRRWMHVPAILTLLGTLSGVDVRMALLPEVCVCIPSGVSAVSHGTTAGTLALHPASRLAWHYCGNESVCRLAWRYCGNLFLQTACRVA
jgi:hypothetical protein